MSTQKSLKEFEQIYNDTYDNVLKYVICKSNNLNDVDDIIQETYLEFYKVLKSGKEILDKKNYIIAIAKNKITKYFKSNEKVNNVSIFQKNSDDEDFLIDLDSRYRYRIRIHYQR